MSGSEPADPSAGAAPTPPVQRERYARQLLIPGWGGAGQRRLSRATVVVAGAGGLGCPVSLYLALAGVGQLRICDCDRVAESNLNRQIHYTPADVGRLKAEAAAERLRALNPQVRVVAHTVRLEPDTLPAIAAGADLLVDCLDNFATRYLLNAYSVAHGVPLVHGGVWGLGGQLAFLHPPHTACLRCLFPAPPPPEKVFPVAGAGAGLVATAQALLALRWLTGLPVEEAGRLLLLEGDPLACRHVTVRRDPTCRDCGTVRRDPTCRDCDTVQPTPG